MHLRGSAASLAVISLRKIGQLEVDCEGFRDKVGVPYFELLHYPSRFDHLWIFKTRARPLPRRLFPVSDEEATQLLHYFKELLARLLYQNSAQQDAQRANVPPQRLLFGAVVSARRKFLEPATLIIRVPQWRICHGKQ